MSNVKKWKLNDTYYTTSELVKISGLPKSALASRLRNGWDVEPAITTPLSKKTIGTASPQLFAQGNVDVKFLTPVPGVFQEMQPKLNQIYAATPYCTSSQKLKAKLYYIITLDNGKPLIVYPGEFEIIGQTATAA